MVIGGIVLVGPVAADAPDCGTVSYDGSGTDSDPYQVTGVDQLQCINENHADATSRTEALSSSYELVSDIDASGTETWNSGDGFDPVGDSSESFTGTFDGQGYTITGLTIDRTTERYIGLFGAVGSSGTVRDVLLNEVDVTGLRVVGALVGDNDGTVVRAAAIGGSVDMPNEYADANTGGLVGTNSGTVEETYATVAVSGSGSNVGGLVGYNTGTVRTSYATGDATSELSRVGGLVGQNAGTVEESYATGAVTGSESVGGLVGDNAGSVTDGYWDAGTTGQTTSAGSPDANGLSTSEMQGDAAVSNMAGFDFPETWLAPMEDYPILAWQNTVPVAGDDSYRVTQGDTLRVGSPGVLSNDVDPDDELTVRTTPVSGPDHGGLSLSADGSFTYTPNGGFSGQDAFTYEVYDGRGGTDTATVSISVRRRPADFTITIDSTTAPVAPGDTLDVTAIVSNAGGQSDTQVLALAVNGVLEATRAVSLTPGESRDVTLSWTTEEDDIGEHAVRVASNDPDSDASDSTTVTVARERPNFAVSSVTANESVVAGERFNVTAAIENVGAVEGTQNVSLSVNGTERDSRSVTLGPGESATVTLTWATDEGDAGNYTARVASVNDSGATGVTVGIEINVFVEDTSVETGETIVVDISASRGGRPFVAAVEDADGDIVATRTGTLGTDGNSTIEFTTDQEINPDDGPYTVTVTDNRTNSSATTDEITVSEAAAGSVTFNQTIYSEERGDVARIGLELSNTDNATVTVGDASENNYVQNVTVRDGNGDGFVTILFNTYTAGTVDSGAGATPGTSGGGTEHVVFDVAAAGDSIENVGGVGGTFDPESAAEQTLAANDYTLSGVAGGTPAEETPDGADTVATLTLGGRSTEALTNYVLPGARLGDIEDVGDIERFLDEGIVTETSVLAEGDALVVEIDATGLEGVLKNHTDGPSETDTEAFFTEAGSDRAAWEFRIERTNPGPNSDGYLATLNVSNTALLADADNNDYWLVVDTAGVSEFSVGDALSTEFTTRAANGLNQNDTTVSDGWVLAEAAAAIDTNADIDGDGDADEVEVRQAAGQQITGTTTVAPGTELSVLVRGTDRASPFVKPLTATVQPNGTWTATGDFSANVQGANFSVDVRRDGTSLLEEPVDGRVLGEGPGDGNESGTPGAGNASEPPGDGTGTVVDQYDNDEGEVATDGLRNALNDWSDESLTTDQLVAVIDAWAESG